LVLARRREGSESGTPETLRFAEAELSSLDISLNLVDRDSVFSPIPGEGDVEAEPDLETEPDLEAEPDMEVEPDVMAGTNSGGLPKEWMVISEQKLEKPACSEKEQRELEADLERIADRLTATLSAACSRKKKRRK
jgi:pilus assembly protein FimV